MKFVTAAAAVALLAATSFAYASGPTTEPDNLAYVTQIGTDNGQITIQTADPTRGRDQDPANLAVTTQIGTNNGSFTLQSAKYGVTNASYTDQVGTGNKSAVIQGPGRY